ncbi:hypothetical protein SprV_0100021400 [Sparganum proliferum]
MGGEDHVRGPTVTAEAALAFRQLTFSQMVVQAVEENASKDLPGDVKQGDASMVLRGLAITFPLMEMGDFGVLEILRDFSSIPYLPE